MHRTVDQHGQVIDVLISVRRDADAARRFFHKALSTLKVTPAELVTDAAAVYPAVLDDLVPSAWHHVEQYANNPIEADHSRLKHPLRSMRGLRTEKTAQIINAGRAFMQNLRRGHYEGAYSAHAWASLPRYADRQLRDQGRTTDTDWRSRYHISHGARTFLDAGQKSNQKQLLHSARWA